MPLPQGRLTIHSFPIMIGLFLCWPLLTGGLPTNAHDTKYHVMWAGHFASQFWAGELYPRWLVDANSGLGSPVFFFYPPLPYWATSLFTPLFPQQSIPWNALGCAATLGLALSGMFMLAWLRRHLPDHAALAGALTYQIVPYHLALDLYVRAAWAEFWAMVWLPLILYGTHAMNTRKTGRGYLCVAAAVALLSMSHLLTLMMVVALPLAYAASLAPNGQRWRTTGRTALAIALGLTIAAAYIVPAIYLQYAVSMDNLWTGAGNFRLHFFRWKHVASLFGKQPTPFDLYWLLSFLSMAAAACLSWGIVWYSNAHKTARAGKGLRVQAVLWITVTLIAFWMCTAASSMVWELLPPLHKLQFPWRFGTVLSLGVAGLVALAVAELQWPLRRIQVLCGLALLPILLSWVGLTLHIMVSLPPNGKDTPVEKWQVETPEYRTTWTRESLTDTVTRTHQPDGGLRMGMLDNGRPARHVRSSPRNLTFEVYEDKDSWLTVAQFHFPGWHARIDDGPALTVFPTPGSGLVSLPVPAGHHVVRLELGMSLPEKAGWLLSGTGFLVWLGLAWHTSRRRSVTQPEF